VTENPALDERRGRLEEFVRFRRESLTGDEKGEAQVFLDRFFQALGHAGVFEAGATLEQRIKKHDQRGTAFADLVWKPRVLVEMKKEGQDLARHYRQAFEYWIDLVPDRPHYVVLCNFDEFWVYDLNQQLEEPVDRVALDDLPERWEALAFLFPVEERPTFQNDLVAVTRDSAALVSGVFNRLIERGVDRDAAQRFVLQSVMAMFAEDIGLLPRHLFTQAVDDALAGVASPYDLIFGLFDQMNSEGPTPAGRYQGTPYFNGGLFREIPRFELEREEVETLKAAAEPDWSKVRPAIFGTLFEQSMEMDERHAYGAHFTSEADIQKVVLPTIVRPWRERIEQAGTIEELGQVENDLLNYRVLDPACGCGNFLYVAYREMRRLERDLQERVQERRRRDAEAEMQLAFVSTTQFYGLDINEFAVEVAKVTMMLARKLAADELGDERNVLPLDDLDANITAADALEVAWPAFDSCISNPPYLGRRRIVEERGVEYADFLKRTFPEVGGVSDYVVYWFRKTHDLLPEGQRAGLVGTNTIRQGDTRKASVDYITENGGVIYDAISSLPWSGDATVEVSIVNWAKGIDVSPKTLWLAEGTVKLEVDQINGSLSPEIDVAKAAQLAVNRRPKVCFQGQTPGHTEGFTLSPEQAAGIVSKDPASAEVIHPFMTGDELNGTGRPGRLVIDIPAEDLVEAQQWPGALEWVKKQVLPVREARARTEKERNAELLDKQPDAKPHVHHQRFLERWWQLAYRRADMVAAIEVLPRYIALSIVAVRDRPSIYAFVSSEIRPAAALQVFAFADDYSFAILQSALHRAWFDARASTMRHDPRYTPNTVFDSFPWPQAPTDEQVADVVAAAAELLEYREQQTAGGMTFAGLYDSLRAPGQNRLRDLHDELDRAVIAAYGFSAADEVLAQLLALNESITAEAEAGLTTPRGPGATGFTNTVSTSFRLEPIGLGGAS
jgi:hypothetical protein